MCSMLLRRGRINQPPQVSIMNSGNSNFFTFISNGLVSLSWEHCRGLQKRPDGAKRDFEKVTYLDKNLSKASK